MKFFNLIIISFLIQLTFAEENDTCEFGEPQLSVIFVQQIAGPSKSFINMIGLEFDISELLGLNFTGQGIDINQYFYEAASFGGIFIILFLILFLYFLFFLIFNCCKCCHAKKSKKPKCIHIIFHYIGVILLVVTAVMMFFSSISTLKVLTNIKTFPDNLHTEIDDIFNHLNTTLLDTFDVINDNIDNFVNTLNNFSDWMSTSSISSNEDANNSINLMLQYNDTFGNEDLPYMEKLISLSGLKCTNSLNINLAGMNTSRQIHVDVIVNLAEQLLSTTESISETVFNIKNVTDTSVKDIKKDVSKFKDDDLAGEIDGIRSTIDDFPIDLDKIVDLCEKLHPIVRTMFYIFAVFSFFVGILYASIFFCRNTFSRIIAYLFPLCGLILNIIIVLPGCIFAILFILFNDLCPDLEKAIDGVTDSFADGSSATNMIQNISELLICEDNTPILRLLDLGFNPDELIDDFAKTANESFDSSTFEIPKDLTSTLDRFGENFNIERDISSDTILNDGSKDPSTPREILNKISDSCPDNSNATEMIEIIDDNDPVLEKVRTSMKNVLDFGQSVVPKTEELQDTTMHLIDKIAVDAKATINGGLDEITCKSFRCVYAPFKNMLCVDFMTGLAFWVLANIVTIVGVAILSITVCLKRRTMANKKIKNASSGSGSSMDEFQDNGK